MIEQAWQVLQTQWNVLTALKTSNIQRWGVLLWVHQAYSWHQWELTSEQCTICHPDHGWCHSLMKQGNFCQDMQVWTSQSSLPQHWKYPKARSYSSDSQYLYMVSRVNCQLYLEISSPSLLPLPQMGYCYDWPQGRCFISQERTASIVWSALLCPLFRVGMLWCNEEAPIVPRTW